MPMCTSREFMDGMRRSKQMNKENEPLPVPEDDEDDRIYCGLLEED